MPTDVTLPQLSESTYEATVGKWLKQPGDRVARFEPLVELITDKVNVEMPSPVAGVLLEQVATEGDTLPTGAVIARMEVTETQPATAIAADASGASSPRTAVDSRPAPAEAGAAGPRLSPLGSRLLQEHGVPPAEWASIPATGSGGRLSKNDVMAYLAARAEHGPMALPATDGAAARGAAPVAPTASEGPPATEPVATEDEHVRLDPIRKAIADRMARAKREIPHAHAMVEVDMTALVRWHDADKAAFEQRHGVRVTYTAFFVRAAVEALRANRFVNAQWRDDGILVKGAIHLGVAVSHDDALLVPVLHDAQRMDLAAVARGLDALVRKAREGHLGIEDIQGGTFTITNPGVYGSIESVPVINPPQVAILVTNAITPRAVVRDDAIAIRRIMNLGLSFDHRVFDGPQAMRFLNAIKAALEAVDPLTA